MKPLIVLDPEKLTPADRDVLSRDGFDPRTERQAFTDYMTRLAAFGERGAFLVVEDAVPEKTH